MDILQKQISETRDGGEIAVGYILKEISEKSAKAKELILQDLEVEEMSISNCDKAIYEFAKKNQKNGVYKCPVTSINADNEIIALILDFYKIPKEWLEEPKEVTRKKDFFDFLNEV